MIIIEGHFLVEKNKSINIEGMFVNEFDFLK